LLAGNCFSQQVIATAGSTATGTGIELSWTIGEPVTATAPGSGFYLTQGFHQGQPEIQMHNQELSFNEGWNIISTRVIPGNRNMMDVFQSLIAAGHLKKVMNEEGKTLEDWGVYGGWTNGIGNLTSTEGYKVNVRTDANLSVEGAVFLFPFHIQLTTGWNIISWPSPNPQTGMDVFKALIDAGKLKKVMNESGQTIEDWGIYGGWTNNIGNLKPGEGYNVNVTGDCTLIINESGTKSEVVLPNPVASTHFTPAFRGNGTDHMNIHLVNLAESGIKTGDEIGIFDGNVCVGSVQIQIQNHQSLIVNRNSISIPVSANDGLESKNGFTPGNSIEMKLYRNGVEYPVTLQPLSDNGTLFKKGSSLFAQVGLATGVDDLFNPEFTEINVYPNPFSELITIEIVLASKQKMDVKVYDIKGALVRSLFQNEAEGKLNVYWNGRNQAGAKMISGTYFIKVNESTFKVLLE
jgi:hypothetical protein